MSDTSEEKNLTIIIQERKYSFNKECFDYDKHLSNIVHFKKPQEISLKIGDIQNNILISSISYYHEGYIQSLKLANEQEISFKIGDIQNKAKVVGGIIFSNDGKGIVSDIRFAQQENISFKIGDIINTVIVENNISFYSNGLLKNIRLVGKGQTISLKIGDTENKNINVWSHIYFYDNNLIQDTVLLANYNGYFYYNNKKYKLSFQAGEDIYFKANGELDDSCINNSSTRLQEIAEQDRIYNLEKKQQIATEADWRFVWITGVIGAICIGLALFSCIFNNTIGHIFNYNFNYEHETFNRYTFFYEILKRTPIFILFTLGFKFLQLAFERLRLIGKVEQVRNYIALTADDNTKKDLLKTIAIPFFAPKKVKSSFFERLIDKVNLNVKYDTNDKQETKTNSG